MKSEQKVQADELSKGSDWKSQIYLFQKVKIQRATGNQNRLVETESHTSELGSLHSFWERCGKLYMQRF